MTKDFLLVMTLVYGDNEGNRIAVRASSIDRFVELRDSTEVWIGKNVYWVKEPLDTILELIREGFGYETDNRS